MKPCLGRVASSLGEPDYRLVSFRLVPVVAGVRCFGRYRTGRIRNGMLLSVG